MEFKKLHYVLTINKNYIAYAGRNLDDLAEELLAAIQTGSQFSLTINDSYNGKDFSRYHVFKREH